MQAYAGIEMPLIVQAKDTCNAKRLSGASWPLNPHPLELRH